MGDNGLPPGHEIGRYRIERELGRGGFGITYLARELRLGSPVAIKEYYPQGWASRADNWDVVPKAGHEADFDWGLQSFVKEAKVLWQVQHPNIVRVHSYGEHGGTGHIAMEFVEGESLSKRLARQVILLEADIRQFVLPIMDGLAEVHSTGFLHLDIAPKNIMVTPDGRGVLLDFGAARPTQRAATGEATVLMTPSYAALEQHTMTTQSPATDIYSLGAVLYCCVTGQPPWHPTKRVESDHMPRASDAERGSAYSSSLLAMIDAALAVQPEDRPQSIADWQVLLNGFQSDSDDWPSGTDADEAVPAVTSQMPQVAPPRAAMEPALLRRATGGRLRSYRTGNHTRAGRLQEIRKALCRGELVVNGFNRWRLLESRSGGAHWTFADAGRVADALVVERAVAKREAGELGVWVANDANADDTLATLRAGTDRPDLLFVCRDWSQHRTRSTALLDLIRLAEQRRLMIHMIVAFGPRPPPDDELLVEARRHWLLQRNFAAPPPVTTSEIERRFGECLREAGLDPVPQVRVARYFLDFAVRGTTDGQPIRLDVEVDGRHWHEELPGCSKPSDVRRDNVVRSFGWRPVRIWTDMIERDQEECVEQVRRELASPVPFGPLPDTEEEQQ